MTTARSKLFLPAALLLCLTGVFAAPGAAEAEMEDYGSVKLQTLDKITARTMSFEARVGATIKFGTLFIKVQACRKPPPVERPEAAAFLQVWEVTPEEDAKWVFSGWMFASSPGLSSMDHPIYDVWVIDCMNDEGAVAEEEPAEEDPAQAEETGQNGE